jgi:hypothetical protein
MANGMLLRLNADASGVQRGTGEAGDAIDGMGKKTEATSKRTKVLAGALAALAATTALMVKRSIDYGDWLDKTEQKTGIAAETLSSYKLAAELAGTSQQALVGGLRKLARNMQEAADGTETQAEAFGRLGIEVANSDGSLRDINDVMLDVADRFSVLEDGAGKTAAAAELFGSRMGTELIPLLNTGADGIARVTERSRELGTVWSTEAADGAAEFNDAITELKETWDGFWQTATRYYLPLLADIASGAVLAARAVLGVTDAQERDAEAIADRQRRIRDQADTVSHLRSQMTRDQEALAAMTRESDPAYYDAIAATVASQREIVDGELELLHRLQTEFAGETGGLTSASEEIRRVILERTKGSLETIPKVTTALEESAAASRAASDAALEQATAEAERAAAVSASASVLDTFRGIIEANRLAALDGAEAILYRRDLELRGARESADLALEQERLTAEEREQIRQASADAIVSIEHDAQRQLFELRSREVEAERRLSRKRLRAIEHANAQTSSNYARTFAAIGTMSRAVTDIISSHYGEQSEEAKRTSRAMFLVQQAVALAIAGINLAQAISQANASAPTPYNIPAIVAATATGVAQIAAIAATTVAGLADAGRSPVDSALRSAGLNRHSMTIVDDREWVVDPQGSSALTDMLEIHKLALQGAITRTPAPAARRSSSQAGNVYLNGRRVGDVLDDRAIAREERGLWYGQKVGTRSAAGRRVA